MKKEENNITTMEKNPTKQKRVKPIKKEKTWVDGGNYVYSDEPFREGLYALEDELVIGTPDQKWIPHDRMIKVMLAYEKYIRDYHKSKIQEAKEAQKREILEKIENEVKNPYPADVFIEPTEKQYDKFNKLLESEGMSPDAYAGSWGRNVWEVCKKEIRQIIQDN
jgi:hypothetical protein